MIGTELRGILRRPQRERTPRLTLDCAGTNVGDTFKPHQVLRPEAPRGSGRRKLVQVNGHAEPVAEAEEGWRAARAMCRAAPQTKV